MISHGTRIEKGEKLSTHTKKIQTTLFESDWIFNDCSEPKKLCGKVRVIECAICVARLLGPVWHFDISNNNNKSMHDIFFLPFLKMMGKFHQIWFSVDFFTLGIGVPFAFVRLATSRTCKHCTMWFCSLSELGVNSIEFKCVCYHGLNASAEFLFINHSLTQNKSSILLLMLFFVCVVTWITEIRYATNWIQYNWQNKPNRLRLLIFYSLLRILWCVEKL